MLHDAWILGRSGLARLAAMGQGLRPMLALTLAVFVLTYIGMALGRVPGLLLDRSGIALVAAVVLIAAGAVRPESLPQAIHFPTIALLFALMIVSARFAAAGFYDASASWIARHRGHPALLLALTIAVGGGLSAILVNDIVVFVMTPLLCAGLTQRGLDPRPYLAALAGAANAGSAATLIGNPQNIVIGQVGGLDFLAFLGVCGPPALAALGAVYLAVWAAWRKQLVMHPKPVEAPPVAFNRGQTGKAALATLVLLALFATPVPRELSAMVVAALMLTSRRFASRDMLASVDWPLLLLFAGLFVVNDALVETGLTADALAWLAAHGWMPDRLSVLMPLALAASNTVGNVPAVLLLLAVWKNVPEGALYGLALMTTLAGNFLLVGSIANLIAAERAAQAGVRFGFADHARAGIPMTLASMAIAALWLWAGGWLDG